MMLRTHLSVVMLRHSERNGSSLVVSERLGELLTPMLSLTKGLFGVGKVLLLDSGGLEWWTVEIDKSCPAVVYCTERVGTE